MFHVKQHIYWTKFLQEISSLCFFIP